MVGAGAGTLLAAQPDPAGIEQGGEIFPPGRRLVARDAECRGDAVDRPARRHRARDAGETLGEPRNEPGIGGEHGEAIARADDEIAPDDQVAVAVAVRGGAEIGPALGRQRLDQIGGMDRVRVGMTAAEIGHGFAVDDGAGGRAQPALEDLARIGAGDRAHRVEAQPEAAAKQVAQPVEIEHPLHQLGIIGDRVDDRDPHAAERAVADPVERHRRCLDRRISRDLLGAAPDRIGHPLGRRAAIGDIEFDAEIAVGAAGVMAGAEDDPAKAAAPADDGTHCRGRQDAVPPDQHPPDPVRRRQAQYRLDRRIVEKAAVAAQRQGFPRHPLADRLGQRLEQRLDKSLDIARLAEHPDLLAQPRGPRPLTGKRSDRHRADRHRPRPASSQPARPYTARACRARATCAPDVTRHAANLIGSCDSSIGCGFQRAQS